MQKQTLIGIAAAFVVGSLITALVLVYSQPVAEDLVVIHITRGDPSMPEEIHPATMGTKVAGWLQDEGLNVVVVLDVRGVNLALKQPSEKLADANLNLKKLQEKGGRILVCEGCLSKAGYKVDDLMDNVEITTPSKLSSVLNSKSTVISY